MLRTMNSALTRILLMALLSSLAACSPIDIAGGHDVQPLEGYPVPATLPPTDSVFGSTDYLTEVAGLNRPGPFPTLSPSDRETFSPVTVASAPKQAPADLSVSAETSTTAGVNVERLLLTFGDRQYVLGAENGTAKWGAVGEHSFAWFFHCDSCKTLDPGLYVLNLETGEQRWIANTPSDVLGSVIVAEPWVLYYTPGKARYHAVLHAYNLDTTKDFILDEAASYGPAGPRGKVALNEGAAAWLGTDSKGPGAALKWIDLETGATRIVVDETVAEAGGLSVSKILVVWAVDFWKVYDSRTETIHALPRFPEDVDGTGTKVEGSTAPIAYGNTVYWSVTIDGVQQDLSVQVGK